MAMVVCAMALLGACTRLTPEQQFVHDVADRKSPFGARDGGLAQGQERPADASGRCDAAEIANFCSLTYGVSPTQSTGATLAALDANVRSVMTTFANAELGLTAGVWVMSASLAIRLSMMRTNQDSRAFPDLSVNGGTFYGLPVIVSNNVAPSGSPGDQHLILIDQSNVLLADDGQMMIDVSTEASLEMNDAPTGGATSLRSLWQNGLMGVKVDRWIHWTKRRSAAVQFIDKAQSYGS